MSAIEEIYTKLLKPEVCKYGTTMKCHNYSDGHLEVAGTDLKSKVGLRSAIGALLFNYY